MAFGLPPLPVCCYDRAMKIGGFYSHWPKTGGLELYKPLGPSGLTARWRNVPPEVSEPTTEVAKVAPAPAIEEEAVASPASPKGEGPEGPHRFRLAADVVESLKASCPGYNVASKSAAAQQDPRGRRKAAARQSSITARPSASATARSAVAPLLAGHPGSKAIASASAQIQARSTPSASRKLNPCSCAAWPSSPAAFPLPMSAPWRSLSTSAGENTRCPSARSLAAAAWKAGNLNSGTPRIGPRRKQLHWSDGSSSASHGATTPDRLSKA